MKRPRTEDAIIIFNKKMSKFFRAPIMRAGDGGGGDDLSRAGRGVKNTSIVHNTKRTHYIIMHMVRYIDVRVCVCYTGSQ